MILCGVLHVNLIIHSSNPAYRGAFAQAAPCRKTVLHLPEPPRLGTVTISNVPAVLCDTEGRVRCPSQASAAGRRSLPGVSDRPSHHVRMRVSHVRGTGASVRSASWTGRGHWSLIRSSAGLAPGVPARGPGFLQVSHEMPRILEPAFQGRPARRRGLRGGANRSFCPSVGLVSL